MRDLIILGTGVHALEMVEIVERVNRESATWNLLGLIGADEKLVGQVLNGAPVLGTPDDLGKYPRAVWVPNLVDLKALGDMPVERMVSLVDPSTFISRTAVIGRGCVFYPNCFVGLNARVDDLVFVMTGSVINHDDRIGSWTAITTGVKLAGSVTVEEGCYLGQGCNVRQLLTIGRQSMIGMGAVVVKDVEPYSVMAGNPARKMRTNLPEA
jgi:sugar O-acyltransferase (sialic acid O-acetyltransferase NeuD family)